MICVLRSNDHHQEQGGGVYLRCATGSTSCTTGLRNKPSYKRGQAASWGHAASPGRHAASPGRQAASTGMMAASWPWRHYEQVLEGDLENPMTMEVMEPSNDWKPSDSTAG